MNTETTSQGKIMTVNMMNTMPASKVETSMHMKMLRVVMWADMSLTPVISATVAMRMKEWAMVIMTETRRMKWSKEKRYVTY